MVALNVVREELYTAVVSDVLDSLGARNQVLAAGVRPLVSARRRVGRAFPVMVREAYEMPRKSDARLIDALDSIGADEVFVTNGLSDRAAFWGELLSNAVKARGQCSYDDIMSTWPIRARAGRGRWSCSR